MKKILFYTLTLILSLAIYSCSDDDDSYSLNKYWVSPATVEVDGAGNVSFVTDNRERLFPSGGIKGSSRDQFENGDRIWLNYTILSKSEGAYDYLVMVNRVDKILTKDIIELNAHNADSIGNDPVRIIDWWFSKDHLSIRFVYGGGGKVHFINLVQDIDNPKNEEGIPVLEFRHNRNDDPYNYKMYGTVSFSLDYLVEQADEEVDEVEFILKARPFKDEEPFERKIKYLFDR
ncbi:NigD-like protein [Marinilabiliaceae bacterium ANBcel2]|nr:NigD-like protein [Marinilabiliaceae bacterium ANBcel2]